MVLGPKMCMRGNLNLSTVSCLIAPWEVFREMKRIKGPSLHLEGYSLRNEFAMNKVEKAGTRLPADASILWGNEMDAYENRIPIHYIKGHTFLGRAGFRPPLTWTQEELESRRHRSVQGAYRVQKVRFSSASRRVSPL